MQFRSTTDEMLAARFDKEPWVTEDGKRQATSEVPYRLGCRTYADYAPRPEFIPSRDPRPWVDDFGGRYASISDVPDRYSAIFLPRPEYARPEPNPILAAFREPKAATIWHFIASLDEPAVWWPNATPAQIEHARLVLGRLTRLANVYKEA